MPANGAPAMYMCRAGFDAENLLGDRPGERAGDELAAELGNRLGAPPLAVVQGLEGLLDRLRHRHRVGVGVEDRRVAVAVDEGLGERALGQLGDLGDHAARGLDVEIVERRLLEDLVGAEDLEEVELDIAHVALEVAHRRALLPVTRQ